MKTKCITSLIILFALALFCAPPEMHAGISQGSESNTKNGNNALQNNTTGTNNSAYGVQALFSNTTGNYNTGVGAQALFSNQTTDANTALGFQALYNNVAGGTDPNTFMQGSTAVGYQ